MLSSIQKNTQGAGRQVSKVNNFTKTCAPCPRETEKQRALRTLDHFALWIIYSYLCLVLALQINENNIFFWGLDSTYFSLYLDKLFILHEVLPTQLPKNRKLTSKGIDLHSHLCIFRKLCYSLRNKTQLFLSWRQAQYSCTLSNLLRAVTIFL